MWEERAACKDRPDLTWFPETDGTGGTPKLYREQVEAAVAVCRTCPVIEECRIAADERNDLGIWGGEMRSPSRKPVGVIREHGTPAGAKMHYRLGEAPCEQCREAAARYHADRGALFREHGSMRGYRQHIGRQEPPCEPCSRARFDYVVSRRVANVTIRRSA